MAVAANLGCRAEISRLGTGHLFFFVRVALLAVSGHSGSLCYVICVLMPCEFHLAPGVLASDSGHTTRTRTPVICSQILYFPLKHPFRETFFSVLTQAKCCNQTGFLCNDNSYTDKTLQLRHQGFICAGGAAATEEIAKNVTFFHIFTRM